MPCTILNATAHGRHVGLEYALAPRIRLRLHYKVIGLEELSNIGGILSTVCLVGVPIQALQIRRVNEAALLPE